MADSLLLIIGFLGAFASGLLGIGGGVILVPMALYLPPLLGVASYSITQVTGMSMVQVLAASILGLRAHAKVGNVPRDLAVPLGGAAGLGAIAGGLGSGRVPEAVLTGIFAVLTLCAAGLMLVPRKAPADETIVPHGFPIVPACLATFGIGVASGMVGIGGGVLLIPLLTTVFRVPVRLVIGTSTAVVLVSGLMGTLGKAFTQQIPWVEAGCLVLGALLGAPLGAKVSHRLPVSVLRKLLAATLLVTAVKMIGGLWG